MQVIGHVEGRPNCKDCKTRTCDQCEDQAHNQNWTEDSTREFEKLFESVKSGHWPNYGAAELSLSISLQSVGSATPDRFTIIPEFGAPFTEEIWDRRKVLEFLRLWVAKQEEVWRGVSK
jgi:hypothetical protein